MSDFIEEMQKIVGKENVSTRKIDMLVYAFDASEIEGETKAVVWAENDQQVADLIKLANNLKFTLIARGGGTGLTGSAVPMDSVVMDLSRMNKILEINEKEKYAVAEAGVILSDLNYALRLHKLRFPPLPASHTVASIGGIIATNAAGMRAVKFGKTRDWVLEFEVVTGNGNVIQVSGEDIDDFCGTEGISGVITKAKLKLDVPKEGKSLTMFKFDSLDELVEKTKELKDQVMCLEFIGRKAAVIAGLEDTNYLIAEFEDERGEVKDHKEIDKIWKLRSGVAPAVGAEGYVRTGDPKIPLDRMLEFLNEIEKMDLPMFGHIAYGIIHPRYKVEQSVEYDKVIKMALEMGGDLSGEHGIGLTKKKFVGKDYVDRMRKLEKKYDSKDVLNRGKVL